MANEAYEARLRAEESIDGRFSVWKAYVAWVESELASKRLSFSHVARIYERCCLDLSGSTDSAGALQRDREYLRIWIKYARSTKAAVKVFEFLMQRGIGVDNALLYRSWSYALAHSGQLDAAKQVLEQGIGRGAQPLHRIEQSLRDLEVQIKTLAVEKKVKQQKKPPPLERLLSSSESNEILMYSKDLIGRQEGEVSFEEVRAERYLAREPFELHDDAEETMCFTRNHSEIVERNSPQLDDEENESPPSNTHEEEDATFPLADAARRLKFVDAQSPYRPLDRIEAFFDSKSRTRNGPTPNPSNTVEHGVRELRDRLTDASGAPPTPTMTFHTREALNEIQAMFQDTSSAHVSMPVDIVKTLRADAVGITINPLDGEERNRVILAQSTSSSIWLKIVTDHGPKFTAPNAAVNLDENASLKLGDADLVLLQRISTNVSEAQDLNADDDEGSCCVKVVRSAARWRAHIAVQLGQRLPNLAQRTKIHIFSNATLMIEPWTELGSLASILYCYKRTQRHLEAPLVLYWARILLRAVNDVHDAQFVHGAIQPRHVLVLGDYNVLQLTDWGSSIDLDAYPNDSVLTIPPSFAAQSLPCTQSLSRTAPCFTPVQLDALGIVSTIHQLLFDGVDIVLTESLQYRCETPIESETATVIEQLFASLQLDAIDGDNALHCLDTYFSTERAMQQVNIALCDLRVLMNT